MTPRPTGRTQTMSKGDVQARANAARRFSEVAQLVADEDGDYAQVCAALAVLAGIAAGDAICGSELGHCSRGQDHRQAVTLLGRVRGATTRPRLSPASSKRSPYL